MSSVNALEVVKKAALEAYGSEEAAEAFMEGFQKAAMFGFTPAMSARVSSEFSKEVGKGLGSGFARAGLGLGAALLGAAIVKGVSSGTGAVTNYQLRQKFESALAQVMANNKVVRGAKPEKAKEYAETLFKFAPHVASDPNLLSSILANAVLGEGIDAQTVKALVDLEGRYLDNHKTTPIVGIKPQ